ncbi:MAG: amidase domain-containing protein [Terrisporobacter sp.]|uniref:amidase domain-containing protein n=1 Tax=Terrisporobacter sp. TaxID=1965305 RepID=UPI002FCC1066
MFYEYDRMSAVEYATKWALSRNIRFTDYSEMGGDCTNFISQCINAGKIPMDKVGNNIIEQWYWYSDKERTPSWSGADFFYNYLTRNNKENTSKFGVYARLAKYEELELGDIVQLIENNEAYHNMIITDIITENGQVIDYLVCQHTMDLLNYPLSLKIGEQRYIKIIGYYK